MTQLLLHPSPVPTDRCGLCDRELAPTSGVTLVQATDHSPVCPACAWQHAPSLAALARLADVATRVGRIGRHTVFPPLTALLDLARAAEQYTATVGGED
jgi:hypothetical protein